MISGTREDCLGLAIACLLFEGHLLAAGDCSARERLQSGAQAERAALNSSARDVCQLHQEDLCAPGGAPTGGPQPGVVPPAGMSAVYLGSLGRFVRCIFTLHVIGLKSSLVPGSTKGF